MKTYLYNLINILKPGFILFPLLLLTSCVTMQEDILYLNDQVTALNKRVGTLEGSVDDQLKSGLESRFSSMTESQAGMSQEIDSIRQSIQRLDSRMEENNQLVRRTVERDTTEQDLMKAKLVGLEKSIKELREHLRLGPPSVTSVQRPETETAPVKPVEPQKKEEKMVPPDERLYEDTLKTYKEGKYDEALAGFTLFLKRHPDSKLADNAQFWIGESFMSLSQYEQAILAYQKVIKKYPNGNKVPNAMLRQALAFYEIKDKISAKLLLKKIIKNYPKTSEAKIAEAKLKTLK